MTKRRDLLKAAGGATAIIGTAGCFSRFLGSGDEGESSETPQEDDEAEQSDGSAQGAQKENATENASTDRDAEESTNETGDAGDGDQENPMNESTNASTDQEQRDDRKRKPTEEETAINRSKYNETAVRETEPRPASAVKVRGTGHSTMPDGTVVTSPTITNVSDEHIDLVDVEIVYLGVRGDRVGSSADSVEGLPAGETREIEASARPDELRGEVDDVTVEVYPQDYVG